MPLVYLMGYLMVVNEAELLDLSTADLQAAADKTSVLSRAQRQHVKSVFFRWIKTNQAYFSVNDIVTLFGVSRDWLLREMPTDISLTNTSRDTVIVWALPKD